MISSGESLARAKERPILFSASMVRAILAGRKTQTRRIVKPQVSAWEPSADWIGSNQPSKIHPAPYFDAYNGGPYWCWWDQWNRQGPDWIKCPFGKPGERLWVRETWADVRGMGFDAKDRPGKMESAYRAEASAEGLEIAKSYGVKWKPSIHMPRWASRITLEVTGVRVERLQEISETDAIAEGLTRGCKDGKLVKYGFDDWPWQSWQKDPRRAFSYLWGSVQTQPDETGWNGNPWVWVIEFKRMEC